VSLELIYMERERERERITDREGKKK